MKRIILFMFVLTLICWGQYVEEWDLSARICSSEFEPVIIDSFSITDTTWITGTTSNLFAPVDISEWDWENEYFTVTFLYLYDEYEKECYADSSQITKHVGDGICVGLSYGYSHIKCESLGHYDKLIWIHRDPNLPGGFIEFLRSKLREEK